VAESFIKVIDVQVLTLGTRDGTPDPNSRPIIRFELEDGREFIMVSIPTDIALNLSMIINDIESNDSRLYIHQLIGELALVEKVEIDLMIPQSDVYQATIYLKPEGFEKTLQFQMVPSNATLIALSNSAPIYVAETLVKQAEEALGRSGNR